MAIVQDVYLLYNADMDYNGVIIEESLSDKTILKDITIVKTRRERVIAKHQTPWLTQWTLHTITIKEDSMGKVADDLSKSIDESHASSWYMDFKNEKFHYIIFKNKIFRVDIANPVMYKSAREYGLSLGIPSYQMQFERLKR